MNHDKANQVEVGEGPKAADAALQRIVRSREAAEAEAPFDTENVSKFLGDLDLGADVGSTEAIEHVCELDAVAEAAVECAIAKAEAYEAQDVVDEAGKAQMKLREQIRAAIVKYSDGAEVAKDDPLATHKIRVSRYLKKFGLTLDDLPSRFWDEPDETVRGGLLGDVVGPVMATRRFEKRVERSIAAGYPADYYSRPIDEQKRIGNVVRKRRSRAKRATKAASTPKAPLPTTMITKEWIRESFTRLKSWTAGSDPMAIQLRSREKDFVKARAAYRRLINALGREPKQAELAAELGCKPRVAQNRINQLRKLESVDGPWHEKR